MFIENNITLQSIEEILKKEINSTLQEEFSWDRCLFNLKLYYE